MKKLRQLIVFLMLCLLIPTTGMTATNAPSGNTTAEKPEYVFHGNKKSFKFHAPDCRYYHCKNCTIILPSLEKAQEMRFSPCSICKPQHYAWRHAESAKADPEKVQKSHTNAPKTNPVPETMETNQPVAEGRS